MKGFSADDASSAIDSHRIDNTSKQLGLNVESMKTTPFPPEISTTVSSTARQSNTYERSKSKRVCRTKIIEL
jgi:hypothetical protein